MTDMTIEPPLSQQLTRIDEPMERKRVGDMVVTKWAGLTFNEYREAIEFSKLMAQARNSVPAYLKQNPGDCLAIVTQALRWHLEPYWVAQHSYVARAESLIAYDSAVHTAILLSSGILTGRPLYSFNGEGEERTCTVQCQIGQQVLDYITPPLRQCRPPKNEQGVVKGSPLWTKDPDQQLGYYAIRNWGRRHTPELLGGVYDRDEFNETTQDVVEAPTSPNLIDRLPARMETTKGFQENVVDETLKGKPALAPEKAAGEGKAEGEADVAAKSEAPATPNAKGNGEPSKPAPKTPATADEYMTYAARWIERLDDEEELKARWDGEKELRVGLGLPLAVRKRLEGMLHAQIATVQQGRKRK